MDSAPLDELFGNEPARMDNAPLDELFGDEPARKGSPPLDDLFGDGSGETALDDLFGEPETATKRRKEPELPLELVGPILGFIEHHSHRTFRDFDRPGAGPGDMELKAALTQIFELARKRCWVAAEETLIRAMSLVTRQLEGPGWPHICWREAHGFLSLLGAAKHTACEEWVNALRHLDLGVIMGLPRDDAAVARLLAYVEPRAAGMKSRTLASEEASVIKAPSSEEVLNSGDISAIRTCKGIAVVPVQDLPSLRKAKQPVVLRGVADHWPASKLWRNLDFWEQSFGHRTVPIELGSLPLNGKAGTEASGGPGTAGGGIAEKALTISEFVTQYLRESVQRGLQPRQKLEVSQATTRERPPVAYLAQHQLFNQLPRLQQDFEAAPLPQAPEQPSSVNVWFGTGGTVTPLHFDGDDNVLVQVAGLKLVRLYDPSETKNLYIEKAGGAGRYGAQGNLCLVDVEDPDLEKHPRMQDAVFSEHLLRPGEALYIPNGTWHYLRSLTTSISVNYFYT